jgi:hypothetical protein
VNFTKKGLAAYTSLHGAFLCRWAKPNFSVRSSTCLLLYLLAVRLMIGKLNHYSDNDIELKAAIRELNESSF